MGLQGKNTGEKETKAAGRMTEKQEQGVKQAAWDFYRAGRITLETAAKTREGNKKDLDTYYSWWVDFCSGNHRRIK
jgi:hypothetical protein